VPVATVDNPSDYSFWIRDVQEPMLEKSLNWFGTLGRLPTSDPVRAGARKVASEVHTVRHQLRHFSTKDGKPNYTSPVSYPGNNKLAEKLRALAAMLAAGLPMRFRNLQGAPPDSPGLPRNLQPFTATGPQGFGADMSGGGPPKARMPV
jgi:hypothetical protein